MSETPPIGNGSPIPPPRPRKPPGRLVRGLRPPPLNLAAAAPLTGRVSAAPPPLPPALPMLVFGAPKPRETGAGYRAPDPSAYGAHPLGIAEGLESGRYKYDWVGEGATGSRVLKDAETDQPLAIVKFPEDELGGPKARLEARDCPRAKNGIRPGHGVYGDPIAFALFPEVVPPSSLVSLNYPDTNQKTVAMVQMWIPDATPLSTLTEAQRNAVPEAQFEMLSIADLALANTDRNAGNLLISKEGKVYAIDTSLIAPQGLASEVSPSWYLWPQAKKGFSEGAKTKILSMKEGEIVEMIRTQHPEFPPGRLRALAFSVMLLKECAAHNLTIQQTARLFREGRADNSPASVFLKLAGFGADRDFVDRDPLTYAEGEWLDGPGFEASQLDTLKEAAVRFVGAYAEFAKEDQVRLEGADPEAVIKLELSGELPSHRWVKELSGE